ncbi:sigma-70 family RNA polymerase sigma factor [Planococcus ruber]|uniref:sigma-70 family RNA polymerase sigma factor n=1 Tax=Planococcus ruber TaxID=2027871 RepID=UPI001FEFB79D|nr:sigma-70 family RNA polymerase sigma factor [Planococcus ruber]
MDEITFDQISTASSEEIINEAMKEYGKEILQLVYSYVKNRAAAEDLTQEIFIKCYKSLHTYKQKSTFRTWLWRIAINHSKDYLKSWHYKNIVLAIEEPFLHEDSNIALEKSIIQKDEDEELAAVVMKLPVIYREVIYLYYFQELSIREIAATLMKNESTIKTRLKRAKELLKESLEG